MGKNKTSFKKGHKDLVSPEARKRAGIKISKKLKGRIITKKWREKISKSSKGRVISKRTRERMSISQRKRFENPEEIRKCLRRRTPSSLEWKMINIIQKLNLPYKFIGNGQFFIEKFNPDFIEYNGKKIAIEVFYRRHKEQFRKGLEKWKQERQETFNKYGWKIIFFNETEVNERNILIKLGGQYC